MLNHVILITEILATIICIHCIYGQKFKLDLKTTVTILILLTLMEIANFYQMAGAFSFINYIVLFIYCKNKFRGTYKETIISVILCIIILTSIQFICLLCIRGVIHSVIPYRNLVCNALLVVLFSLMLRMKGLHRLQKSVYQNGIYVIVLLVFIFVVVLLILLQGKYNMAVQLQYFALIMPAIFLLLYSIVKWYTAQNKAEKMESEIYNIKQSAKAYDNLLTQVRLRQHDFKII